MCKLALDVHCQAGNEQNLPYEDCILNEKDSTMPSNKQRLNHHFHH